VTPLADFDLVPVGGDVDSRGNSIQFFASRQYPHINLKWALHNANIAPKDGSMHLIAGNVENPGLSWPVFVRHTTVKESMARHVGKIKKCGGLV
jgi:hypothetical protein